MKHILTRVLSWAVLAAAAAGSTSCLNEYLDKAPDAGLDEKEVFSKYANFKSYFYAVYNGANFNIKATIRSGSRATTRNSRWRGLRTCAT